MAITHDALDLSVQGPLPLDMGSHCTGPPPQPQPRPIPPPPPDMEPHWRRDEKALGLLKPLTPSRPLFYLRPCLHITSFSPFY